MLFKAEPHPRAHPGCQRAETEDARSGAGKAGGYQPQLQEKQSSASAGSQTARKRAETEAARPCELSPRHGRVNLHLRTAGRAPEAAKRRPSHAATVGAPRSAAGCCAQGSKRASEHAVECFLQGFWGGFLCFGYTRTSFFKRVRGGLLVMLTIQSSRTGKETHFCAAPFLK